jgi:hypothetical protein
MTTSELFFSQNVATLATNFSQKSFLWVALDFPPQQNKTQFRAMFDCYRRNSQFFYIIYLEIGMDFEPQIVVTGQKHSFMWKFSLMYILLLSKFG